VAGSILLIVGVIVLLLRFQALQSITSQASQVLLFSATQEERDSAWGRLNDLLFGGGILSVIGLTALIVGVASKAEESSYPREPLNARQLSFLE
jgi:hypothetical protein